MDRQHNGNPGKKLIAARLKQLKCRRKVRDWWRKFYSKKK